MCIDGGRTVLHCRKKRLAVPAVERAVVARFAARGEDEVVRDHVAAAKAVVGVDAGAGALPTQGVHAEIHASKPFGIVRTSGGRVSVAKAAFTGRVSGARPRPRGV